MMCAEVMMRAIFSREMIRDVPIPWDARQWEVVLGADRFALSTVMLCVRRVVHGKGCPDSPGVEARYATTSLIGDAEALALLFPCCAKL